MSMELYQQFREAVEVEQLVAQATVIAGSEIGQKLLIWPDGTVAGSLATTALGQAITDRTVQALQEQRAARFTLSSPDGGEIEVFADVYVPPLKLIVVGAVHMAIPLVQFANTLGFHTVVVDARGAFATPERFPHADELIIRWPADALNEMTLNEATYLVVLTHDAKIDNPALLLALAKPIRYIGALGSRKTHAKRVAALQELGATEEQLARIHAPIGLYLGGRGPEEIAVSIIAEIVAVKNGVDK